MPRLDSRIVATILLAAIASCQANPTNGSSSHKEIHLAPKKSVIEATTAPQAIHHDTTLAPSKKSDSIHKPHSDPSHATSGPELTKESLAVPHESAAVNSQPSMNSKGASSSQGDRPENLQKFCDYMTPICNSTEKITPKQLSKIQGQLKKIVQMSAGKLSFCFLDHYGFDPNMSPITRANLLLMCSSKDLAPQLKGSLKSFETCASQNWDPNVDIELDKILAARVNCTKNHNHTAKIDTIEASSLTHGDDEDELSLISDVVNKVFEDNKGRFANSSDVKFIDVSTGYSTQKPSSGSLKSSSVRSNKGVAIKEGENAFKNDLGVITQTTTPPPSTAATNKTILHQQADLLANKSQNLTTTIQPELGNKVDQNKTDVAGSSPKNQEMSLSLADKKASNSSEMQPNSTEISESKKASLSKSTSSENVALKSTTSKPDVKGSESEVSQSGKTTVAPKPLMTTTSKPTLETLEEVLKRQEKEKMDLDERLRIERERIIKQLQKKKDELNARNAIKALQLQRDASSNKNSDAKLHQLEHERQMAIDPIGHTIKHREYEMDKQQRMMNGRN